MAMLIQLTNGVKWSGKIPHQRSMLFLVNLIGIKPEFEITIYPKFWLQLSAKVGYQQIRKLELPQVNPADFSGFFYSLGLKINLSNE